ncbi:hypothetical protein, partial [Bradyrhizobium uaiense]|uniref:hypothetical protein n=1 Tax=Bradyrhizobium uaiense TaxID=2594946 RepID=UPI001F2FCA8A
MILFDHRSYGTLVGRLIVPSFILPAAAASGSPRKQQFQYGSRDERHHGEAGGKIKRAGVAEPVDHDRI